MELRQLEYFVAVVEEGTFTRAAERMHVTQPGVSAQIRRLERELGQELLDRSGRRVRLTDVGAAVFPHARAALAAVAAARQAVDELTGLVRGRVAVGMVTSCPVLDLPALLAEFHRRHPGVEITLSEADSDRMVEELRTGRLDLAIIGMGTEPPPGLWARVLTDEALFAAVAPGDPLAGRETVALAELRGRSLICLPSGTGVRSCLNQACAEAGFAPRVTFEATDPEVLVRLAARGMGVAVLPESLAVAHADQLRAVEIVRPRLRSCLALAWRAEGPLSPAAKALLDHARAILAAAGEEQATA
ncbi:MAG TPA: LysR family transcriptional regulator [Pseudonocardiaceae bacterium]